jgi:hypothetical protein
MTARATTRVAPTEIATDTPVIRVSLALRDSSRAAPEVEAGSTQTLQARFEPLLQTITRRADGSVSSVSTKPWPNPGVRRMRLCLAVEIGCPAPGELRPFESSYTSEFTVDWLGPRYFNLETEFLDENGAPVLAVNSETSEPRTRLVTLLTVTGILGTTPLEKLPGPVLTAAAGTRAAFPVSGSVLIEGGRCCAGGTAGTQVNLNVAFQAASPAGRVTEMKVQAGGGGCVKDPAQLKGDWEPFQPAKSYAASLAINFVGWYVSVQYRDEQGNLSPVYCDDISLEGSPPAPSKP